MLCQVNFKKNEAKSINEKGPLKKGRPKLELARALIFCLAWVAWVLQPAF